MLTLVRRYNRILQIKQQLRSLTYGLDSHKKLYIQVFKAVPLLSKDVQYLLELLLTEFWTFT